MADKLEATFARLYDQLQHLQLRSSAAVELERERLEGVRQLINDRYDVEAQANVGDATKMYGRGGHPMVQPSNEGPYFL